MMRARTLPLARVALAAALLAALVPHAAFATEAPEDVLSPAKLIEAQKLYDGRTVTIEGEAIGEALRADGDSVWVNVLGETLALGVVMDRSAAEEIGRFGDYDNRGDTLRVTGEFNISCGRHPGETDVHAETVEIVAEGEPIEHAVSLPLLGAGLAAVALAAFLGLAYRRRERRLPTHH